jgi:excisionase family DNA binding protein
MSTATAAVYRAIADPHRRTILDLLRDGEQAVVALGRHFRFSQPALSQHLRVLLDAGLVVARKVGRERRYALDARGLRAVHDWVGHYEAFWRQRLDRLGRLLDEVE